MLVQNMMFFYLIQMSSMLSLAAVIEIGLQLEQLSSFDLLFSQTPTDILKRVQTIDTMEKLKELFVMKELIMFKNVYQKILK